MFKELNYKRIYAELKYLPNTYKSENDRLFEHVICEKIRFRESDFRANENLKKLKM